MCRLLLIILHSSTSDHELWWICVDTPFFLKMYQHTYITYAFSIWQTRLVASFMGNHSLLL